MGGKIWKNTCDAGFGKKVERLSANMGGGNGAAIREVDRYARGDGVNVGEGGITSSDVVVPGAASVGHVWVVKASKSRWGGCCGRH